MLTKTNLYIQRVGHCWLFSISQLIDLCAGSVARYLSRDDKCLFNFISILRVDKKRMKNLVALFRKKLYMYKKLTLVLLFNRFQGGSMVEFKKSKFGIAAKTSMYTGIVVFCLLSVACFFLIKFETNIIAFVLEEHVRDVEQQAKESGTDHREELRKNMEVASDILSGVAGPFINDVDDLGCQETLKAFMEFPSVTAIQIMDEENLAFAAAWKDPSIVIGNVVPDGYNDGEAVLVDAVNDGKTVGKITIYYTDRLLVEKLDRKRQNSIKTIELFSKTVNSRIDTAIFNQIIGVLFIIIILIVTVMVCLKTVVIKPISLVINNLKDIAEGEGDLTVRLNIKSGSEIGELGNWFDLFMEKLQVLIKSLIVNADNVKVSSGDLSSLSKICSNVLTMYLPILIL